MTQVDSAPPIWVLPVSIALYVTLALIYLWQVPPFEGPDEGQHFAYITWLVQQGSLPPQGDPAWAADINQEASQPPLYYFLASLPARLVGVADPVAAYRVNPHYTGPLPRTVPDNDNRAVHYPTDGHPLRGGWLALYLARGVTLLFGLLLVVATFALAHETAPRVAWGASLLVAVIPQVLFLGSVVSNDVPVAALGTLTLWAGARAMRRGLTAQAVVLTALFWGLAILTKASALALLLPLTFALLWTRRRFSYRWRHIAGYGLLLALATVAVSGWWFLRNWLDFGSLLGLETHDVTPWAIQHPEMLLGPLLRWQEVFRSFWISLGWGTIRPPGWVYSVLALLVLIAVGGLAWLLRRRDGREARVSFLLFLALAAAGLLFFLELWMRRVQAPFGRLLFPGIAALVVLLVAGWRVWHRQLPWLATGFVAAVALATPWWLLRPAFTPPPLLSPEEVAAMTTTTDLYYGEEGAAPVARLLQVEPLETSAAAGTVLPVRVCWQAMGVTDRNYTVFLHLVGPENQVVASRRSYPGGGRFPTPLWQEGDAFCEQMHVAIPEDVPRTLAYQLEIGLIDEIRKQRLQVHDAQGTVQGAAFVSRVRLVSKETQLAPPEVINGAVSIQLLDADRRQPWHAGAENPFTLTWAVARPVDRDYQLFVHLRDPETGAQVAQADGPPLSGWYPTSWWTEREIVVDTRLFPLSANVAAREYDLVVGFYDLATGKRLDGEQQLGRIRVSP